MLGVSPDDVKSHQKFRAKYRLPYSLLADTEHQVAEAFGVWKEKSLMGHKYWGIDRTTFLIDPAGGVARVFEKVNPDGHANEVASALAELQG